VRNRRRKEERKREENGRTEVIIHIVEREKINKLLSCSND